jgi:hypothetical protein
MRLSAALLIGSASDVLPAGHPAAEIGNGEIRAKIYLPDARNGYYQGTRFDWSGVVHSLQYKGHEYYGPWYRKIDPSVRDFVYRDGGITAGPCSAIPGPVDEFRPVGWDAAKPGGTFVKIGVGALRKPEQGAYESYTLYTISDPGKWTVRKKTASVEFTHRLNDTASGYGYIYTKTVRLTPGQPEMVLEHRLKNTGARAIDTTVYNHNFLTLDKQPTGEGLTIAAPFKIETPEPPEPKLAEVRGKQIVYLRNLEDGETARCTIQGFGAGAADHNFRIENSKLGFGMSLAGDRPLQRVFLWSIRATMAVEPFVAVAVEPGREFTWKTTYRYYTLPAAGR